MSEIHSVKIKEVSPMNQLIIAVLISTSLAGVIQGGFVSSSNNNKTQHIDQQPTAEVSQVVKDDLTDFMFIDMPEKKTSSTIIQNDKEFEHTSYESINSSIKDTEMNIQSSANAAADATDRVETKDVQSTERRTDLSKIEKAVKTEKTKENKVIKTPAVEDKDEVKETSVKSPIEEEVNKNTETAVTSEVEEVDEEINTSAENSEQDEKIITVKATAYTADCEGGTGVTYTGIDLKANPNQKVIAVDPSVIPLGTKVYVEGYGHAIAGDIGGAIKGNKIDVFIPSQSEAEDWGIKTVDVKILED